jgi:glycosyltransferase involved in cell wall biosynthesis
MLSYKFSKIIKARQYDLIHFNGNDLQQLLISFFIPRCPKVHTIHDYTGHSGERNYWAENFNRSLINSNKQKIIHAQSSICHGQDGNYLREKRISIILYGPLEIYQVWKNDSLREENNNILFFGRISPYKGIEYLINAVPIIKEKISDLKVTLAGEGSYYFDIKSLKENSTYQIINRYIPNKELVQLIQKSVLVVCPYTDATQSGVIMTAYAFNKPVVATNVGGISEIVKDDVTGRLVPPRDSQRLAEAIIDLLKHPEKRKTMAENICRNINEGKFNWSSIAKQTIEVYKKAIGYTGN